MNTNCILIPIWYGHVDRLLHSASGFAGRLSDVDLVFIASGKQEQIYLSNVCNWMDSRVHILDIDEYLLAKNSDARHCLASNTNNAIINLKKLFGLLYCFENGAKNVAVIDSDIHVLPNFNSNELFNRLISNHAKAVYWGGGAPDTLPYSNIVSRSIGFMMGSNRNHIYLDPTWYGWFYDIPFYRRDDFIGFLHYLSELYIDGWWRHLMWETFDHILYIYYRILNGSARVLKYVQISDNIPEMLSSLDLIKSWIASGYYSTWVSTSIFLSDPSILSFNQHIMILYHSDRVIGPFLPPVPAKLTLFI